MIRRVMQSPLVRGVLLGVTFAFIGYALSKQWGDVRAAARVVEFRWHWIVAASVLVLATYAALIQSWRMLLAGWGGRLSYSTAVRIWTVANLGRYLPGKVWSISALGVMAAGEGVSGVAAAGAAVLGTLLNIGAGFAVAVVAGATGLDGIYPGLGLASAVGAVCFVVTVAVLPWLLPAMLDRFARWRGLPVSQHHLSPGTIWLSAAINTTSWAAYGVAFFLFAQGVTPQISRDPTLFIAGFAASYLVGFLTLFAPGGVGVRELALSGFLVGVGAAGEGDAIILGATSRIWLTILEVGPGLIGLVAMSPAQRASLQTKG